MPLTKDYQRFGPSSVYGCISSDKSNSVLVPDKNGEFGTFIACSCGEKIALYNIKTRELMALLPDHTEDFTHVCRLTACKKLDGVLIAAGYSDGWVRIINAITGAVEVSMRNHSRAITALCFTDDGSKLICGSRDKEITVVDLSTESGYRLKGHGNAITCVRHISEYDILVSSSSDGVIKFWHLKSKICFKTLPAHQKEISDMLLLEGNFLLSASDGDLQLWKMEFSSQAEGQPSSQADDDDDDGDWGLTGVEKVDTIARSHEKKILSLVSAGKFFIVVGRAKCEIFLRVESKKKKKKAAGPKWKSETLTLTSKVVSADAVETGKNGAIQVLFSMMDNSVELRHFSADEAAVPRDLRLDSTGHRFPVNAMEVSEDGNFVLSCSQSEAKLWNKATGQFVSTLQWPPSKSGPVKVTCASFAPGERQVIFGSDTGTLMLFDLASRQCLANIAAHDHAVTSVSLMNRRGGAHEEVVTGSLDGSLKLWQFTIVRDADSARPTSYSLTLHRHVAMPDKVTCLCPSPDGRVLAVALMETSIRLVLADSLKICLTLRGHSMPTHALDISSDSMKLVSGSDDKTVRVWGLQFGDCQTVFHGHENVVTGVRFLPRSDLLVSASKDKTIRLWDGAKFRRVMILRGHQDAITALSVWRGAGAGLRFEEDVSSLPHLLVTASRDHTIRVWEELDELVVLEEEEEMEREREFAEELANEGQPLPGEESERMEHQLVSKRTLETVKAAERIMEGIDECRKEREVQREWKERQARLRASRKRKRTSSGGDASSDTEPSKPPPPPPQNVLFAAYEAASEERFMLEVVSRVRRCDLERALLELPVEYARDLLPILGEWVERRWDVELATRCFVFLLDVHKAAIVSNNSLMPDVRRFARLLRRANVEACRESNLVISGLETVLSCKSNS